MKSKEYIKKYNMNSDKGFDHSMFVFDLTSDFYSQLEWYKMRGETTTKKFWQSVSEIKDKYESIFNRCYSQKPEKLWGYFYSTVIKPAFFDMFPDIKKLDEELINQNNNYLSEFITTHTDLSTRCFIKWNNDPSIDQMKDEIRKCYNELDSHVYPFHVETALKIYINRLKRKVGHKIDDEEARRAKWREQRAKREGFFKNIFGDDFDPLFFSMFGGVFERMMKAKQRIPKPISSLAILGLGESATEDDMKKSFRKLVFKYRQDRGSDHNRNKFESIMDAKNKCDVYFKLEKSHNDNL